jgi:hypothetical protein
METYIYPDLDFVHNSRLEDFKSNGSGYFEFNQ